MRLCRSELGESWAILIFIFILVSEHDYSIFLHKICPYNLDVLMDAEEDLILARIKKAIEEAFRYLYEYYFAKMVTVCRELFV